MRGVVSSLSLHLVESGAANHTNERNPLLDELIIDDTDKLISFVKFEAPFIAGHDFLELTYTFQMPPYHTCSIVRRDFRSFDDAELGSTIQEKLDCVQGEVEFDALDTPESIDYFISSIEGSLLHAFDRHASLKTLRVSKPPTPWLTMELKARIRRRTTLYKQARRANSLLGYAIYRKFRDELTSDLKRAKSNYNYNRLAKMNNQSRLWSRLCSFRTC